MSGVKMGKDKHNIRRAGFADALAIFNLVKEHPEEVLPRPLSDIIQNVDRFLVCERDGQVVGTVSWQILPEMGQTRDPSIEIKSLCVKQAHQRAGIGHALAEAAIARIRELHPSNIIVLTFTPGFFERLGFQVVSKETLMHKIYAGCINCSKYDSPFTCPEIAMSLRLAEPS